MNTLIRAPQISGSGGSSSKGSSASEDPNTARSASFVSMLHIIGSGPLRLKDGAKSIYFDGTPLMAADGTYNFRGVKWKLNPGTASQDALPGFAAVKDTVTYGVEVTKHNPAVRTVYNPDASSVRVTTRIMSLCHSPEDGGLEGSQVSFRIEARPYGGAWKNIYGTITVKEKFTAPLDRDYQFKLPMNATGDSHPWDIRVTRLSNDSDDQNDNQIPDDEEDSITDRTENRTVLQAITEIVEYKLSYPYTAHVGMIIDVKKYGGAPSSIEFDVVRQGVKIPSNYNPETRAYTGTWNGTFTTGETDNPAWVLYDILSNKRDGLGRHLSAQALAMVKWDLYAIAQYCDEMIPDGYGGTEPRFTFNGAFTTQREAYDLLSMIASTFRGMIFWSSGMIRVVADMPKDPVILVTPANVIGGRFTYEGTSLKSRTTVVHVTWKDPDNGFKPTVEVVEDQAAILRFGRRVKEVVAVGCTSRGQSRRYGLWKIATDCYEDQVVTYKASFDHAYVNSGHPGVVPGDVVSIQDPKIAGVDWSGRLLAGSDADTLVLDREVTIASGVTHTALVTMPTGATETATITSTGTGATLSLASPLSAAPPAGAVWVISSPSVAPRPFQVISVATVERNVFEVKAAIADTTKYDRIDYGVKLRPRTYTKIPVAISAPRDIAFRESRVMKDGAARATLTVSWSAPEVGTPVSYHAIVEGPAGTIDYGQVSTASFDIVNVTAADYTVRISAIDPAGRESPSAAATHTAMGWTGSAPPYVANVVLLGGSSATVWKGRNVRIGWSNVFPSVPKGTTKTNPFYKHNTVTVIDLADLTTLGTHTAIGDWFSYDYEIHASDAANASRRPSRQLRFSVTVTDIYGRTSDPVTIDVTNPVPDVLDITVEPTFDGAIVDAAKPDDDDFAGIRIWSSETSGFDPATTAPVYDGTNTSVAIKLDPAKIHYLRVAGFDAFGKTGLQVTSERTVSTPQPIDFGRISPSLAASIKTALAQITEIKATMLEEVLSRSKDRERATRIATDVRAALAAVDDATASAIETLRAEITEVGAIASQVTDLEAKWGAATANGNVSFVAAADQSGALARYQLKLKAVSGGAPTSVAGFTVEVISASGVAVGQIKFSADRFIVQDAGGNSVTPLSIVSGKVFMDLLQVRHQLKLGAGGYGGSLLIDDGA